MKKIKKTQTSFAKEVGTTPNAVCTWLQGRRNASFRVAQKIVMVLGGDPNNHDETSVWREYGDVKKRNLLFNEWVRK